MSFKIIESALLLGGFGATVGLSAGLIVADAILISYGIAIAINKLIERRKR